MRFATPSLHYLQCTVSRARSADYASSTQPYGMSEGKCFIVPLVYTLTKCMKLWKQLSFLYGYYVAYFSSSKQCRETVYCIRNIRKSPKPSRVANRLLTV